MAVPTLAVNEFITLKKDSFFKANGDLSSLKKQKQSYKTVDDHYSLLEQEFEHLYNAYQEMLKENSQLNKPWDKQFLEETRLTCLGYAENLLMHERIYLHADNEKKYRNYIRQLKGRKIVEAKTTFQQDLAKLADTPRHSSSIKAWLNFLHMNRLSLVFSRLTWKQFWSYAQQMQWLEAYERTTGTTVNTQILDAPIEIFSVLSVSVLASRLLLNAGVALKHTFTQNEIEQSVDMHVRLWRELKKRHWVMVNDLVWASVNCLTNYALFFHLVPIANYLLAGFLVFDAIWILYAIAGTEFTYAEKRNQYDFELAELEVALNVGNLSESDQSKLHYQIKLKKLQLEQLEIKRYENLGTYLFALAAALLIISGFSAAILISSPIMMPICFFLCSVSAAMYMSCGQFGAFIGEKKKIALDDERKTGTNLERCGTSSLNEKWNQFGISMLEKTFMPLLIVGTFTINLPLAVIITATYVGYKCGVLNYLPTVDDVISSELDVEPKLDEEHDEITLASMFACN